ncbi:MAG: hypothetical protein IT479_12595 [Xanthomonadales bacterium]|nr:hypothetical protein [Xanthomonadales bacterium]MCC6594093.1 hypothetical protein [Xanthomonadales bacterium]MCE7930175.1 hypothetical protein [Xanthomonadales bacterium PRO6]
MKYRVALTVAGAVLTLAGCASTSEYTRNERVAPSLNENDFAYIAAVERVAHRRGVDVYWIHPPKKVATSGERVD